MLSKTKLANRNFRRSQRRKKRLEARSKTEGFEQYNNRKRREYQANHRPKRARYEADDNDL